MATVIIVGGGPSGLMAAYAASLNKNRVLLFEKNDSLGKKLSLTGHGRCNITNACSTHDFFNAVISNPKFLYAPFYQFSNQDMIRFLEDHNLNLVQEENGRMFPKSQSSKDVIHFFQNLLNENKVDIHYNEPCIKLLIQGQTCIGIQTKKQTYTADTVIVCTGGFSLPQTGSTGDGYIWAKQANIQVKDCYPGLSAFILKNPLNLAGLSLKNIAITIKNENKTLYKSQGDILFTHQGISGPMILNASSIITQKLIPDSTCLYIDSCPMYSLKEIDQLLLKEIQSNPNKQMTHILNYFLPKRWNQFLLNTISIATKKANQLTKQERSKLAHLYKEYPIKLHKIANFNQAMITQGGISGKEIDPKTMSSKKIQGLKFAGEILDLDANTGGYNLQIAWTTGYVAGIHS